MIFAPGKFASFVILLELCMIVIFGFLVEYDDESHSKMNSHNSSVMLKAHSKHNSVQDFYPMFQDVDVMIIVGFGFLMTFAKKYGYSAVGLNMFLSAFSIQWAIIMQGVWRLQNGKIRLSIVSLLNGNFAAAAVLISFGALLGKTSPLQLLLMALVEITLFTCNEYIGVDLLKATDIGGSIIIHTFGAYFGLAVSAMLFRKDWLDNSKESSSYHSDIFAMVGTLFLWMFWPSFNSAMATGDEQHRCVLNTYAALLSCCVVTFAISSLVNKDSKFNMVHIQNATLAGGVAVGATANVLLHPYGALVVGALAGMLSTLGYTYLTPFLLKRMNLHDTCGVNNLHGMPGVMAGVLSIILASVATEADFGYSLYNLYPARSPASYNSTDHHASELNVLLNAGVIQPGDGWSAGTQAISQLEALLCTLVLALTGGAMTGYILRHPFLEPPKSLQLFDDADYWDLPDDE